jgi:hypothetical protein
VGQQGALLICAECGAESDRLATAGVSTARELDDEDEEPEVLMF